MSEQLSEAARTALMRLEASRLQSRISHACDSCAKAHRKCVFTHSRDCCDKCLARGSRCHMTPRATGQPPEDPGASASVQTRSQHYPDPRVSGGAADDQGLFQSGPSGGNYQTQYQSNAAHTYQSQPAARVPSGMEGSHPAPQVYTNASVPYASDGGLHRQVAGPHSAASQVRASAMHYQAAGGVPGQSLAHGYVGGDSQWAQAQSTAGHGYSAQTGMYSGAVQPQMQRQIPASVGHAQSPVRTQTYDTQAMTMVQDPMYQPSQNGRQQTVTYATETGYGSQSHMAPDSGATDGTAYARQRGTN